MRKRDPLDRVREAARGCVVPLLIRDPGAFPGDKYVLTRWTPSGWPCFRRVRDPKYFGDFVVQTVAAVDAALAIGRAALGPGA